MYTLAVRRDFIARHFLIGGDWGPENNEHAHHYRVEVQLEGSSLDKHGYLVDIVDIGQHPGYGKCTEALSVHVADAAERTVACASP